MKEYLTQREDKINYLKGLIRMSKADGVVVEEEKNYFLSAAVGLNMTKEDLGIIEESWENDVIALEFSSKAESVFFIQSAIQISMVDDNYDENERNEVRKIAIELDVKENVVEQIEAWVNEGIEWRKKGELLIERLGME